MISCTFSQCRQAVAVAALVLAAACADSTGEEESRFDGRDFSFAAGGKVKLPERIPADVDIYEGGRIVVAQQLDGGDFTVTFATADPPERVESYYRDGSPRQGWRLRGEAEMKGKRYLGFVKEGRALTVVVSPEAEGTLVNVSHRASE